MKTVLVHLGGVGSGFAAVAAAAPCCLPFLASVAATVGLGSLLPYSGFFIYLVQAFGVLAVIGAFLSFRKHRKTAPLAISVISVAAIIFAYNILLIAWVLYTGLAGLVIAAIWNTLESRRCDQCPAQA